MAKVKLTLSVEESVVELAKNVAKKRKVSLSEMIESFLLTYQTDIAENSEADMLRGIAKSSLSNLTDKEIKELMFKDKYNI